MDNHIHIHLYAGAAKSAPATDAKPVVKDCGCGGHKAPQGPNRDYTSRLANLQARRTGVAAK